jgi:ABC-type polysaccharide/polyol phosphate transport system ATPase subunit
MKAAIHTEALGKRYVISHKAPQRYLTLRDEIAQKIGSAFRGAGDPSSLSRPTTEDFWAVRDVSFEVREGDRVGIVGRNGAGKSTLLKMLSRITEPTEGRIVLNGRVASLLEVGTGFHPELTGRENIFLNGSILGMSRREIQRKFEEIVTFAGVEKFLDTPVKHYSSGMYVRLAFAVAAHLDSEILLVDEVLAVGDAEFQAKCLARMESISESGRTVLFVSHNVSAVQRLCNTGVFMNDGRLVTQGSISKVLEAYQVAVSGVPGASTAIEVKPGQARLTKWELESASTRLAHTCISREECRFVFTVVSRCTIQDAYFGFAIWDSGGQLIVAGSSLDDGRRPVTLTEGEHRVAFDVRLPIKAATYQLDVSLNGVGEGQFDRWHAEPKLTVLPTGDSSLPEKWHGLVNEKVQFTGPDA